MIAAVKILPKLRTSRLCIYLQNKTFTLLTGILLILLTFDLYVVREDGASMLLTKALDSIILIIFLTQLSLVTDAMGYAIRIVQRNLIVIIHTVLIVSTLSYTIDIRILQHHGKTTFALQATLKITEIKMISLHSRSSSKIVQDTNSFLLNKPNFGLLPYQLTLSQLEFGINSFTIYAEYFTHARLKYSFDVF